MKKKQTKFALLYETAMIMQNCTKPPPHTYLFKPHEKQKSLHSFKTTNNINPLPQMLILGFSSSTANKDMMSKIWMNGDRVI